jgi:hypothetical protein
MDSNTKINEEGNENKLEESNIKNEQQANTVPNEITKNILEEKEKDKNLSQLNENTNSITNNEKEKRTRRGKSETTERIFKCPDCEKSYLSGPALIIHRKTKHNYNKSNENKARGRPKKEPQNENYYIIGQNQYNNFLNNKMRKQLLLETSDNNNDDDNNNNKKIINTEQVKENLNNIFNQYKLDIFSHIDRIENYPFYVLMTDIWDKDNIDLNMESYKDNFCNNEKTENYKKYNSPSLDYTFILYLKEFSPQINKDYFLFMSKFVIFFREWINKFKKDIIKEEYKTENKNDYSQIFSADSVPDYCNDFFIEFMEPKEFFGLNNNEFLEIAQHFCFWLYLKKYSPNYLVPIKPRS